MVLLVKALDIKPKYDISSFHSFTPSWGKWNEKKNKSSIENPSKKRKSRDRFKMFVSACVFRSLSFVNTECKAIWFVSCWKCIWVFECGFCGPYHELLILSRYSYYTYTLHAYTQQNLYRMQKAVFHSHSSCENNFPKCSWDLLCVQCALFYSPFSVGNKIKTFHTLFFIKSRLAQWNRWKTCAINNEW